MNNIGSHITIISNLKLILQKMLALSRQFIIQRQTVARTLIRRCKTDTSKIINESTDKSSLISLQESMLIGAGVGWIGGAIKYKIDVDNSHEANPLTFAF